MAQLGQPLTSWKDMAPHEKALFAIFGLQFFLGDRKAAVALMNNLNLSCRLKSKRDQGRFSTPVYSLASASPARNPVWKRPLKGFDGTCWGWA
ncbi:Uncharacterised protein [Shigella sonnei]|nr:Uncharacterised protein [Shigella sonnei]